MLVFRRGHEHPGQRFQQRKEIIVNRHEKIASTIAARVSTGFALAACAAAATMVPATLARRSFFIVRLPEWNIVLPGRL